MGANRNTEQRYKLFIYLLSIIKKQILLTVNNKQILLTVSKKQILLTVSKKQIFCVSIVSTLLLLAISPFAKNRHPRVGLELARRQKRSIDALPNEPPGKAF